MRISDGFLLSEKDLLLRGSGEFFGYHQHGMPDLKAADIIRDLPLLEEARREAAKAVDKAWTSPKNSATASEVPSSRKWKKQRRNKGVRMQRRNKESEYFI